MDLADLGATVLDPEDDLADAAVDTVLSGDLLVIASDPQMKSGHARSAERGRGRISAAPSLPLEPRHDRARCCLARNMCREASEAASGAAARAWPSGGVSFRGGDAHGYMRASRARVDDEGSAESVGAAP